MLVLHKGDPTPGSKNAEPVPGGIEAGWLEMGWEDPRLTKKEWDPFSACFHDPPIYFSFRIVFSASPWGMPHCIKCFLLPLQDTLGSMEHSLETTGAGRGSRRDRNRYRELGELHAMPGVARHAIGQVFGLMIPVLVKRLVSHIRKAALESWLYSEFTFSAQADPWRLQVMAQVAGILPPAQESQTSSQPQALARSNLGLCVSSWRVIESRMAGVGAGLEGSSWVRGDQAA